MCSAVGRPDAKSGNVVLQGLAGKYEMAGEDAPAEGPQEQRSGTSTPRLRLTLKLSEPKAEGGSTPPPAPAGPPVVRRQTKRPSKAVQPLAAEAAFATPPRRSHKAIAPASPTRALAPAAAAKGHAPESFVGRMRAFRARPWRLDARVAVAVLPPAQPFHVPCWTRPDTASAAPAPAGGSLGPGAGSAGSGAPKADNYAKRAPPGVSSRHLTGDGPWPCPHAGCAKEFDTKLKWRRHQAVHNKRMLKAAASSLP